MLIAHAVPHFTCHQMFSSWQTQTIASAYTTHHTCKAANFKLQNNNNEKKLLEFEMKFFVSISFFFFLQTALKWRVDIKNNRNFVNVWICLLEGFDVENEQMNTENKVNSLRVSYRMLFYSSCVSVIALN